MESTDRFYETIKTKHLVYSLLLVAAFAWPWVWMMATGSAGEGDLVDLISLGTLPAIIISAFIVYKEAKPHHATYKWAFAMALSATFLLVWIIPAVGIFGRSGDPADLPFYGVLVVGIIGACVSHFRPRGMAFTLFSMAIAQMLVSVIGLVSGLGSVLILNLFFVTLWLGSAVLFWYAAQEKPKHFNK